MFSDSRRNLLNSVMSKYIMVELSQGYLVIFNLHRALEIFTNFVNNLTMVFFNYATFNIYYYYNYTAVGITTAISITT